MDDSCIIVKGARANNLKNVSLEIPRGKFVVVTGISGSGKSSLVFDTLYAEGQRRYAESLSSYARQFLGRMNKPDVDMIEGIPPAIAVEQKVSTKNPRSTVATTTEIYDFIRLIFARVGHTFSPVSGCEVRSDSVADVVAWMSSRPACTFFVLSDLGWSGRDDKVELLLSLKEKGYGRLFSDGVPVRIDDALQNGLPDEAMLLVDRFRDLEDRTRLLSSISDAFAQGDGRIRVVADETKDFSARFELDGMQFRRPDEYLFSFNSPLGACPVCGGLGRVTGISEDLVVPDKTLSLYDGCIACWRGEKMGWFKDQLISLAGKYGIDIFTPYCRLPEKQKDIVWNSRSTKGDDGTLIGINEFFEWVETQRFKIQFKYMLSRFSGSATCPSCRGSRLRPEAHYVRVAGKTITEVLAMTVEDAVQFFANLQLDATELEIIRDPLSEVRKRLQCLMDVGLGYLALSRACNTLSGGETQRVNLVTALGSSLVGSLYILDEPSVGLHPRDTARLISVLRQLRDLGNTVVVVEHDEDIIKAADVLVDMGPRAGEFGGELVFRGRASEATTTQKQASLTLQYVCGSRERYRRTRRDWQYFIRLEGAMEHNLKGIDVNFPLGVLTVVSGVSGSGKSSLVGDILYPALYRHLNESGEMPGAFRKLSGNLDRISRVEYVDQNPIGKSARSNAVTYLKVYDLIRSLLSVQPYAKVNGYGPSSFSFNQDGGRCPECQGEGSVTIQMQFISDVKMVCEECGGKRFKQDILEVRYRGKNVDDILNMSVSDAILFFAAGPEPEAREIAARLQPLVDVGLGYIRLGQSSSTLSGGESQRIKLAYFLSVSATDRKKEKIMFIFDEPTTGLHFFDVEKLLKSFDALLAQGHSIVVVEHNPDVIRSADWVIELGPDAGERGGTLVFEGTPETLKNAGTLTSEYIYGRIG